MTRDEIKRQTLTRCGKEWNGLKKGNNKTNKISAGLKTIVAFMSMRVPKANTLMSLRR